MASSVVVTKHGGYDCLQIQKLPIPPCGKDDVLVSVKASGLNFADIYLRQGSFPGLTEKPPFVLGLECAGDVHTVGEGVTHLKKGDRVACFYGGTGLMRDTVCISAARCFLMPDSMSYQEGAALLINYCTAYYCLFELGGLKRGNIVFVHSVAGGVGFAVTQLAKTVPDVKVIGTASQHKHQSALNNGADKVFTYDAYQNELKESYPLGVDIFIDIFSGKDFTNSTKFLRPTGKLIHIGAVNVVTGEHRNLWATLKTWWGLKRISVLDLMSNNIAVSGFNLLSMYNGDPKSFESVVQILMEMYKKGSIKPHIDTTWNMNDIQKATERLAKRENIGKVILLPNEQTEQKDEQ